MLTTTHQVTISRCSQIINHKLWELTTMIEEADEQTREQLLEIFDDCPLALGDDLAARFTAWSKLAKQRVNEEIARQGRKYLGIWGEWDSSTPTVYNQSQKVMTFSEFTSDNGYSESDIEGVNKLIEGCTWTAEDGNHIVIKIKD